MTFPIEGRKHGYNLCKYGTCAVCDIQHRLTGERRKAQRRKVAGRMAVGFERRNVKIERRR